MKKKLLLFNVFISVSYCLLAGCGTRIVQKIQDHRQKKNTFKVGLKLDMHHLTGLKWMILMVE